MRKYSKRIAYTILLYHLLVASFFSVYLFIDNEYVIGDYDLAQALIVPLYLTIPIGLIFSGYDFWIQAKYPNNKKSMFIGMFLFLLSSIFFVAGSYYILISLIKSITSVS